MRLKDKAVIVTGSSTGIGEGIARRFVSEGARVLVHGLEEEQTKDVAGELGMPFCCNDLANPESPKELVRVAMRDLGRIDGVVNNAASVARSNLHTITAAFFDRIIAINTRAPMLMIQAALPHLVKAGGSVLNVGSVNAHCGEPNLLAYSISKGGLMTMTRNLADALGSEGVRVNQINPGWVLTENEYKLKMSEGMPSDWPQRLPKYLMPFGRMIAPEDVASVAVYWIGDESRPISGTVMDFNQYPMIGRNPPKEVK
jgi:NAD(P)-dependent dehydrogenase (short-subunit alcohol dehydrogenase family)